MKILEKHARKTKRTKTDMSREWIRSLITLGLLSAIAILNKTKTAGVLE